MQRHKSPKVGNGMHPTAVKAADDLDDGSASKKLRAAMIDDMWQAVEHGVNQHMNSHHHIAVAWR